MGTSIVAGRNAPPILEPCKQILDFVALLIERLVIGQRDFPAFGGGYAGLAASFGESIPDLDIKYFSQRTRSRHFTHSQFGTA